MPRSPVELRDDAIRIWKAGLSAVEPERLLPSVVSVDSGILTIDDWQAPLEKFGKIVVVGGGKAGAGMAVGLEAALGSEVLTTKKVTGWINVPEGCVKPTSAIHLHPGRPAGVNEPQPAGVVGTREILRLVGELEPHDLCICLLSGGGSALLPAPAAGVSLEQKRLVTQLLSAAGANIEQLNCVRSQLSDIKGGGLARACHAGTVISLIISDVLGDPLDVIASGPTVESHLTPADALAVLDEVGLRENAEIADVVEFLVRKTNRLTKKPTTAANEVRHFVLANNATAVDAAGMEAERLGYNHAMHCSRKSEQTAEEVGRHLAQMALEMRENSGPNCLITGGEPTVELAPADLRGKGGRNQQLVLAAAEVLGECQSIALLSGGTDGEDGPTDAAGGFVDQQIAAELAKHDANEHLRCNNAYPLLKEVGGLLTTGPTHTNVCDIRVVVVDQQVSAAIS